MKIKLGFPSGIRVGGLGVPSGGVSDTTAPTVEITSTETSPSYAYPIPITITFSESVTGFTVDDITVANCTLGEFSGSGATYTVNAYPTNSAITVDIAGGVCVDGAGNGNTAATQFAITSSLLFHIGFGTDDAAPISNPYVGEYGSLVPVDSGNRASVSGGRMDFTAGGGANDPRVYSSTTHARAAGRTALGTIQSGNYWALGWASATTGVRNAMRAGASAFTVTHNASAVANVYPCTGGVTYSIAVVLRSTGQWFFVKGGEFTNWTLIFVSNVDATVNEYAMLTTEATSVSASFLDNFRVVDMGTPFSDEAFATNKTASPGVGATSTAEANAIVEMTWTAVTGQDWNLYVRRVDDSNAIIIRSSQGGSTIKVIKIEAAAETELNSVAQTFSNGVAYRVCVYLDGSNIKTSVDNTMKNSTTSTYNASETGVKTDRAGSNLNCWPRVLSGVALTLMNKINP